MPEKFPDLNIKCTYNIKPLLLSNSQPLTSLIEKINETHAKHLVETVNFDPP